MLPRARALVLCWCCAGVVLVALVQVMFGLFYGLCFIPVVLSIVYPKKHVRDSAAVFPPGQELVDPQTPAATATPVLSLSASQTSEI